MTVENDNAEVEISADKFRFQLPSLIVSRLANQALDVVSPATEAIGYLGDLIRGQRQIASARNFLRIKEILEKEQRPAIETDRRFMIEWVDRSSSDVDGELTEQWARLLISQSDGPSSLKRSFIDILAAIGAAEVHFLSKMYARITTDKLGTPYGKLAYYGSQLAEEEELRANWSMDHGQRVTVAGRIDSAALDRGGEDSWLDDNYQSLILLRHLGLVDFQSHGDDVDFLSAFLTPLGIEFVESCSSPQPPAGIP